MKLIHCNKCGHVFSLTTARERVCDCGASGGRYVDNLNAEIWGECTPLGFANFLFQNALDLQPEEGWGKNFEAFVIPKKCETVKVVKTPS